MTSRFLGGLVAATMLCAGAVPGTMNTAGAASVEDVPTPLLPGAVRPDADLPQRVPQPPGEPVLEIPPMVDRPFEEDEGDRVFVQAFELRGARDLPRHGIRTDEIEELLESLRTERQAADGFTIGQLDVVADEVTRYYRQRGLILSRAVVPVQTVSDGVVEIEVIEGRLGEVITDGNEMYSDAALERPFAALQGEPVSQQEVESALLRLLEYPGLASFGMFQPGQRVGEADMVLRVQNEDRTGFSLRGDNHGTDTTGEYRVRATFDWNNPTGNADRLRAMLQQSVSPANSIFGSLDYDILLGSDYRAGAFYRTNEFDVGGEFEELDISGESDQAGVHGSRSWIRSREQNLSTRLQLANKQSRTLIAGNQQSEENLTVLSLDVAYDSVDARFGGLNFGGVEISQGFNDLLGAMGDSDSAAELDFVDQPSRRNLEGDFAEGEFTKILAFYSRLQTVTSTTSLLARLEYQHSDDLLVPIEQYAIGGPDHVRAFDPSRALMDRGGMVSLEYLIQTPFFADREAFSGWQWREVLQFSVFYDHAQGERIDPLPSEPQGSQTFAGYGVAARFNMPGEIESRLQVAKPTQGDEEEDDSTKVWFDLTYHF